MSIEIDGSYLEGGGQIIRTAVALSAITQKSVHILNIRKGREKPGLKPQHLEGIKAAARICGAEVDGLTLNSLEISFCPKGIKGGNYTIDTKTAGSITLILQILAPIGVYSDVGLNLTVKGGTAVPFSPTIEYFEHVLCNYLEKMGTSILVETKRHGFYPAGGGVVKAMIAPGRPKYVELLERGNLQKIDVFSIASNHLREAKVGERMIQGFQKYFPQANYECKYVDANSPGCFIGSHANFEHGTLGADALGKRGTPAERIGVEAGRELKAAINSGAAVDSWMVDQLIPYLGLATTQTKNSCRIKMPCLTEHARTNIWVVEQFLPVKFDIEENILVCDLRNENN